MSSAGAAKYFYWRLLYFVLKNTIECDLIFHILAFNLPAVRSGQDGCVIYSLSGMWFWTICAIHITIAGNQPVIPQGGRSLVWCIGMSWWQGLPGMLWTIKTMQ